VLGVMCLVALWHVSGTLSVLVFSAIDYVFLCVQCVLLVDWYSHSTNNTHCTHKNT